MRIFVLELDNDVVGIAARKQVIEQMIAQLDRPDLVVLPELAICGYAGDMSIWQHADCDGKETASWTMAMADKYQTTIGIGFVDTDGQDYYNAYLLADQNRVWGIVRKCEGESYVFKRGDFGHLIRTPFGLVAVGICYDARRKHLYDTIQHEALSLILFPHGSPADSQKPGVEQLLNDALCQAYLDAFGVPVVYVNSTGQMPAMLGMTGKLMRGAGFKLNGLSRIYSQDGTVIRTKQRESHGLEVAIRPQTRQKEIRFYKNNIQKGNSLFRMLVLNPDIRAGIRFYEKNKAR
ncbi:MAG: carbon-nitrogen hydrolase family protein [Clostridiaceae bacterium]|jgi:predicted amidohydrolase|nr:carbon-nitrogen hydrolase family protein [Clostridiaceae bacterium]